MSIKLHTLTNEYAALIINGEIVKTEYTVNGDGRYMVQIANGAYFIDQLN